MSKQRLIVMPTSNLSFWILASWYLNVSSIIIACLCVGCISLTFFSTSFSMEYWILDEITVKKKKSTLNIKADFFSKKLLISLLFSQRLPHSGLFLLPFFFSSCCCCCFCCSSACSLEDSLNLIQLCQEVWGCKVLMSQKYPPLQCAALSQHAPAWLEKYTIILCFHPCTIRWWRH